MDQRQSETDGDRRETSRGAAVGRTQDDHQEAEGQDDLDRDAGIQRIAAGGGGAEAIGRQTLDRQIEWTIGTPINEIKRNIGKNVKEMETRVAALSGKAYGVMCNSGSSALYLAVDLLGLPKGSEVIKTMTARSVMTRTRRMIC